MGVETIRGQACAVPTRQANVRERLLDAGPESLRTPELLSVVLDGGAPHGSTAETGHVAEGLLSDAGGLRTLAGWTVPELLARPGVGERPASRLLAALELGRRLAEQRLVRGAAFRSSAQVFRHFHPLLRDLLVEQFRVVLLDGKHRLLRDVLVSQGTLTASPVHPREVFAPAIRHSAAAVVLVHNHPSGDPAPSADDLEITRRLVDVGELVGIRVLDHVIVGDGRFTSLADRGLLGT